MDEQQLRHLITTHRASVQKTISRYTKSQNERADLEQETFMRALIALPNLKNTDAMGAWLISIAHNVAREKYRKAQREQEIIQSVPDTETAEILEAGLAEMALRQTSSNIQEAIRLHYFEDLDTQTAAAKMGCSPAAFRQRLTRGRQTLKEIIMDLAKTDQDLVDALAQRVLDTAKKLSQEGKYQAAVDKFMEAFDLGAPFPTLSRMPEDLKTAFRQTWENAFVYHLPADVKIPKGPVVDDYKDWSAYGDLLEDIPKKERLSLIGTIEDIGRRLQINPVYVYIWWKRGLPHIVLREGEIIRFNLALVKQWLKREGIDMPPKVSAEASYFIARGLSNGLRDGILSPEDVEVLTEVFILRERRYLFHVKK